MEIFAHPESERERERNKNKKDFSHPNPKNRANLIKTEREKQRRERERARAREMGKGETDCRNLISLENRETEKMAKMRNGPTKDFYFLTFRQKNSRATLSTKSSHLCYFFTESLRWQCYQFPTDFRSPQNLNSGQFTRHGQRKQTQFSTLVSWFF